MNRFRYTGPVNVEVFAENNESGEKLIKRFLKKCKKQDIVKEHVEKVFCFKSKSQKRRQKIAKNKHLTQKESKKYNKTSF